MKVRVTDLPSGGREIDFALELENLNKRAQAVREASKESVVPPPNYQFVKEPSVILHLEHEGGTVVIRGLATGSFKTECSRCNEETIRDLKVNVQMVLKPFRPEEKKDEQIEDIQFGYYDGKVVDCAQIAEEFLILSLPFRALCSDNCKGLCPKCGTNLNQNQCNCYNLKPPDPRFTILQKLKLQ